MIDLNLTFPPIPPGADKSIIVPNKAFKRSTYRVIAAIVGFVLLYIILLTGGIALAIAQGWLGVTLMTASHSGLLMVMGAAFIPSGLILIYFLIKFVFVKGPKRDNDGFSLTEYEHPQLFKFIRQVTDEVGIHPPKNVYITADVSASASLSMSFINMFFRGGKDLTLGLAFINAINISEFKGLLAHEFGHFSQRGLRIGLYVLNLNKALYNMLYENQSYHKTINRVGRWHWTIALPVILNANIIKGIQAILRKVYVFINKSYMLQSRESEFHADAIAAYTSGANNVISLSDRHDIAYYCYDQVVESLNAKLAENKRSGNAYELQDMFLRNYAAEYNLDTDENGVPTADRKINAMYRPQVSFDDPWSSHPSSEDRKKCLNSYSINAPTDTRRAWILFSDPETLQKTFTDRLYSFVKEKEKLEVTENSEFIDDYAKSRERNSFNTVYQGYYNNRDLAAFNVEGAVAEINNSEQTTFSDIFTDETCLLPRAILAINMDVINLQSLTAQSNSEITSFDYRGVKYYFDDAERIKNELERELKEKQAKIGEIDKMAFKMFYRLANANQKTTLLLLYEKVFQWQDDSQKDYDNYNSLKEAMAPTRSRMAYKEIYKVVETLYARERQGKKRIKALLDDETVIPYINTTDRTVLEAYANKNLTYFLEPNYDNHAIGLFHQALDTYINIINSKNFALKKELLDFQLTLNYIN
jgi:Zn-dependent protease with chaperone function